MQEEELKVKVKPDRFYYCEHCGFKTKWTSALWLHKKELQYVSSNYKSFYFVFN